MTIAEALAALAAGPTDTLKHASLPASWTGIGWQSSTGIWSESEGLAAPVLVEGRPAGTALGIYYNPSKRVGNTAALMVHASGTDTALRQWEIWLHSTPGATPTGYQAVVIGVSAITEEHKLIIREWKEGTLVRSAEASVNLKSANCGVAAVKVGAKVSIWYRTEAGAEWKEAASIESTAFSEGYAGVGGNGSAARLVNFGVAALKIIWELGGTVAPTTVLSGALRNPRVYLPGAISAGTSLAGTLSHDKAPSGPLIAQANLSGLLTRDKSEAGPLAAAVRLAGTVSRDLTVQGSIPAPTQLSGPLSLLPHSQNVYLQFDLGRTSIPYTAERR